MLERHPEKLPEQSIAFRDRRCGGRQKCETARLQIEPHIVRRLLRIGIKTEIARIMQQKHEVKIRRSAIVQIERLNGVQQKIEQRRIRFFFPKRFVQNFGNKQCNARFHGIERYVPERIKHPHVRYALHLPVRPMMKIRFDEMQRLKQRGRHLRLLSRSAFHENGLPPRTFGIQMNHQTAVSVAKMIQDDCFGI